MHRIKVNGVYHEVEVSGDMPLLWVLRDELGLVGTKYGCGIGSCGACKVLINNSAVQSCSIKIGDVSGEITTIEGIREPSSPANMVIQAWIDSQVAQCGYCQPGQIVATVSMLLEHPEPTEEIINNQLAGNLCRCGTYPRIKEAVKSAATALNVSPIAKKKKEDTIE